MYMELKLVAMYTKVNTNNKFLWKSNHNLQKQYLVMLFYIFMQSGGQLDSHIAFHIQSTANLGVLFLMTMASI